MIGLIGLCAFAGGKTETEPIKEAGGKYGGVLRVIDFYKIANLGYPARSQHAAHYDAMMVPLAVDAGLGELSRMGYLISKEFGPRIHRPILRPAE